MMTEKIKTTKQARYLVPGEKIIGKNAGETYRVEEVYEHDSPVVTIRTSAGEWTVPELKYVTVETEPTLDPFAGLQSESEEPSLTTITGPPATEKQINFIRSLAEERDWEAVLTGTTRERVFDVVTESGKFVSKSEASEAITALLAHRPTKSPGPKDAMGEAERAIPAGRYALDATGDDGNSVAFYQVDRPTEGRWAGYTFVKRLLGAPGDWRRERVNRSAVAGVLKRIAEAGPREASLRFGVEAKACGVCGSPLSNDESRALGIGPDCRAKMGW